MVTFRYLSNAIGIYNHSGRAISAVDTFVYKNENIELKTTEPLGQNSVTSERINIDYMELFLNLIVNSDNSVTVSQGEDCDYEITQLSPGFFDRENDHSIYLNYSFEEDGKVYEVNDTLRFVKRVVDNIVQWDTEYF